jgi:hypothetical protein
MQKTLLEDQVESYVFLKSYAPQRVPSSVLAALKERIGGRYPRDYSMQKTLIEDEVKSYLELNR